jgi:ribosomal protein L11 methyltransferase
MARTWPALATDWSDPDVADLVQAALVDFAVVAIDDSSAARATIYFDTAATRDAARASLQQQFPGLHIDTLDVPDEDWAARSQANLRAVRVGRVIVRPPWDPATELAATVANPIVLTIEPSMGFGTGHHATTQLCLAALQDVDLQGRRVLDVGTGSGILAITAAALGAGSVSAIDDDPDAVEAARENVVLNQRGSEVEVSVADLRSHPGRDYDVVVANLTGGLLIATARAIESFLVHPGGHLILSGCLDAEIDEVCAAFAGGDNARVTRLEGWTCAVLTTGHAPARTTTHA